MIVEEREGYSVSQYDIDKAGRRDERVVMAEMQTRHLIAMTDTWLNTQRHFDAFGRDIIDMGFGDISCGAAPGRTFDNAVFEITNLLD